MKIFLTSALLASSSIAFADPILSNIYTCGTHSNSILALLSPNWGKVYLVDRENLSTITDLRCGFVVDDHQACDQDNSSKDILYSAEIEYKTISATNNSNLEKQHLITMKIYNQKTTGKTLVDTLSCFNVRNEWPSRP